jgi:tRNA(Ile)-lysidine synthase
VGFSGGADSMALMQTLVALRHDLGIRLHAAHFNHRLRPQALRDERFVRRWCARLNVPLTVGYRRGRKVIRLSEDDARQMRFKFFVNLALRLQAQSVALAHTRSDLAETVLMRLLRGSGLYGLRGILPQRSINNITFVRPLMGVARSDVEDYLKRKHVPFCTDATNLTFKYARNKIRLKLLPLLAREYNPQITDILTDLAHTAYEDYDFLFNCAQKRFEKSVIVSAGRVKISLQQISRLHPAIRRLIIRQMAQVLTHDPSALTFEHVRAVEDRIADSGHGRLFLPHNITVSKTKRSLELSYA